MREAAAVLRGKMAGLAISGVTLAVLALALETGAWIQVHRTHAVFRRYSFEEQQMRSEDGILTPQREFEREVQELYQNRIRYHPTRWYALAERFHGKYTQTDDLGYRNDPTAFVSGRPAVAFFGGSTMYSTATDQHQTIPAHFAAHLSPEVQALNLGLGGYSSSAELPAFTEALRHYPEIRYAIFYDGMNEVARHVERLQYNESEHFYDLSGYPLMGPVASAVQHRFMGALGMFTVRAEFPLLTMVLGEVGRRDSRCMESESRVELPAVVGGG